MALFIGIDSGTQSTKAVVLDLEARRVIADARAPHQLIDGLPVGHMEQHPADWTKALDQVVREVVARIGPAAAEVRGIGISGQQHGFVPLDAGGEVIRPAKLWCDTSTIAECDLITRRLGGPKAALRRTGNHMEYGDASGTALLDVRRRTWSREALQAIDCNLADWLPSLSPSDRPSGILRPALAARYGLPTGVIVSAGGGDNMMGAIGTGNVTPGVVTASFGTSGTIYARASKPIIDPQGEIAAFCSSDGGWLPLLCTMNVTTVTEQVRTLFGLDHDAMARAASSVPAGSAGLVLLPYLAGERTPNVPAGSGVLFGLNARTLSAPHVARAAMEGVTLGMNYGLRRLAQLGVKPREIRVTGGGAKSAVWRQLMADIFGVPVVAMVEDESAALGGALQAAWTVARTEGRRIKLADLTNAVVSVNESSRCVPDRERTRHYQKLQSLQDRLSSTLRDLFHEHRALLGG
jgi:xylulokinase